MNRNTTRMRAYVTSLTCLLTLIALMPQPSLAQTYDAVTNFSKTSNPNGPWSYGWEVTLGGAFTLDGVEDSATYNNMVDLWDGPDSCGVEALRPFVGFNNTGTTLNYASGVSQPANMLVLHPSCTGKFSVVRWTAPTTGRFSVIGVFQGIDTRGTTTDVHVLQNSTTSLLSASINGLGNQAGISSTPYLTAGDTLDFVVGFGSDSSFVNDSTGLAVTITAQCPPPTITSLSATPSVLWPPNHQYVSVQLTPTISAGACGPVSFQIIKVASNEPLDPDGDWAITGPLMLNLRADRLGAGNGRVYTITLQAMDNTSPPQITTSTARVTVPHDHGN